MPTSPPVHSVIFPLRLSDQLLMGGIANKIGERVVKSVIS
jgi:hypothetical protein